MIDKLINIYPNSLVNPDEKKLRNKEEYYLIKDGSDSIYILLEELDQKQINLLDLLANKVDSENKTLTSLEQLLTKGILDPTIESEEGQLVYLHVSYLQENNFQLWKKTLEDSMSEILDFYLMTDQFIVLLLEVKEDKKTNLIKLEEVTKSLDQDFSLFTQGMIGQITYLNRQTQDVFNFEQKLFASRIKRKRIEGIVSLSEVLIDEIARLMSEKDPIFPKLGNYLADKNEMKDLIHLLFKNQGNLSQTADELFIHRNTLSYRMKQFYDQTGFDLASFPDLILCYLFID